MFRSRQYQLRLWQAHRPLERNPRYFSSSSSSCSSSKSKDGKKIDQSIVGCSNARAYTPSFTHTSGPLLKLHKKRRRLFLFSTNCTLPWSSSDVEQCHLRTQSRTISVVRSQRLKTTMISSVKK
jgi:hypothetical protein